MRAWLYYRLSRDDDEELNSLNNQRKILVGYAEEKDFEVVGESFDDNVSGMHFDREGIEKIYDAVDNGLMDCILVKDLSRLGRHRTQTALFIDYLSKHGVKVLSVTENIDTSNENDDLLIGFKGILNDFYAKDISRKVRAGFRQKQKEGLMMIPPMGYFKDKNTGEILVMEEPAEIVRHIFNLYAGGFGLKAIAKKLNDAGIKSPSYYQHKYLGKKQGCQRPEITFRYMWTSSTVKRTLTNEFYIGTVVNHKYEIHKIQKTRNSVPPEEHIRHENMVPAIITKELWEQVQFLIEDKAKRNIRAGPNKPCHRYSGLLKCGNCGCSFVAKCRYWQGKEVRIEYNCNGYRRYGKEHCSAHRINETNLDKLVYDELLLVKDLAEKNWLSIESDVKRWMAQKNTADKKINAYEDRVKDIGLEIENILMERINDKENREIYDTMLEKRRAEKAAYTEQIESLKAIDTTIRKRKSEIKESIDLIDQIISKEGVSDTHLRMFVDSVIISESEKGLDIDIAIKAPFRRHLDLYDENGEIIDRVFESWVLPA
ncbi:MAG: recombinase family protein [Oscillospiraceae bacterium]|nr:recombinase family protein [Oscillospiraceae bacterium]